MGNPVFSPVPMDMSLVMKAALFAEEQHRGQVRKYTNEPYIVHPMNIARLVGLHTNDPHVICAALLHDTVEDTNTTHNEIFKLFGIRVHEMVVALTDVGLEAGNRATRKEINNTRIINSSSDVHLIKIFDIIDNWKTIREYDPNFAIVFRRECRNLIDQLVDLDPHLKMNFNSELKKVRL